MYSFFIFFGVNYLTVHASVEPIHIEEHKVYQSKHSAKVTVSYSLVSCFISVLVKKMTDAKYARITPHRIANSVKEGNKSRTRKF